MKPDCIIREPHGPVPHRNFKVHKYNLYPNEFNELDYVIKQAFIPKEYVIKDTIIGKLNNNYIFYDIYLTHDGYLSFYREKKLSQYHYIPDNFKIYKKNISKKNKTNYYLIISYKELDNTMYKFKNKDKRNSFYDCLSSFVSS